MLFGNLQATVMIALLQPAEETYRLFDDIMLLSDGGLSDQTTISTCIAHRQPTEAQAHMACPFATHNIPFDSRGHKPRAHRQLMSQTLLAEQEPCKLFKCYQQKPSLELFASRHHDTFQPPCLSK